MALKMVESVLTLIIVWTLSSVSCKPRTRRDTINSQPLLLSPMIEQGDVQRAQDLCKVQPFLDNVTSYSGFLTVDEDYNSNIFFWFFPASMNDDTAPVIFWLFNGAGGGTVFSVFIEIGPYEVHENLSLELRGPSVAKNFSVVYLDVPVGAGFSFTDDDDGYSTSFEEIGSNLYYFLLQFFMLFPKYQTNDVFFVGESYGGKCVTAASWEIHKNNPTADLQINLKGLAVGSAVLDAKHMMHYGDYLYQIGLIDSDGRELFYTAEQEIVSLIEEEEYSKAYFVFGRTITGFFSNTTLLRNLTGYEYIYNFLYTSRVRDVKIYDTVPRFLTQPDIRDAIHVGNATFDISSHPATDHLLGELFKSITPWVEELLENYRVLVFGGQLNLLVPYPLIGEFVDTLDWDGEDEFRAAPRTQWYVGDELAGYSKEGGNLNLVLVRDAGHNPPVDQPVWSLDMITRFVRNERF